MYLFSVELHAVHHILDMNVNVFRVRVQRRGLLNQEVLKAPRVSVFLSVVTKSLVKL